MSAFQHRHGLTINGMVDPHIWCRLFPDDPLRDYPHPGYLPPIRLHDLRHGAATLAHAAGGNMKAISATLRHSSIKITADTYTSVPPEWPIGWPRLPPRWCGDQRPSGQPMLPLAPGRHR
ncbi:hypothetical protein ACWGR4_13435 [Embleya sp. NPDC055664]